VARRGDQVNLRRHWRRRAREEAGGILCAQVAGGEPILYEGGDRAGHEQGRSRHQCHLRRGIPGLLLSFGRRLY